MSDRKEIEGCIYDLAPCPVCGAKSSQISHRIATGKLTIYCNSCGRNDAEVMAETPELAVDKWNNLSER